MGSTYCPAVCDIRLYQITQEICRNSTGKTIYCFMAALGVMDPFVNQLEYISKFAFNFYR